MDNYVNLQPLQDTLEDLLFSVRYINTDHQDTALTVEDYSILETKLKETSQLIQSLLNLNTHSPDSAKNADILQNFYESNHIKEARFKLFKAVLIDLVKFERKRHGELTGKLIESALEVANDSIEKLYGVKL